MTLGTDELVKARPFLKWAGGKGQLIEEIDKRLPDQEMQQGKIDTYVEPFVGGGAVFFHIAQKYPNLKQLVLIDINEDLIGCYKAVKEDVNRLIAELQRYERAYLSLPESEREAYYYEMREKFNRQKATSFAVETAAKLLFLNRTCFNGLYRVNRKGNFNVPFGDYKNPRICDPANLSVASSLLGRADILHGHFRDSERYSGPGTFIYFDPPYRPISRTASFTSYSKDVFSEEQQIDLARYCRQVDAKGTKFLLSNSDPKNEDPGDDFFERHYAGFTIERVEASRAINCKASGRGRIRELLITNYRVSGDASYGT